LDELPKELYNAILEESKKSNNRVTPEIIYLLDSYYFPDGSNISTISS
jgi:hypothetical protein